MMLGGPVLRYVSFLSLCNPLILIDVWYLHNSVKPGSLISKTVMLSFSSHPLVVSMKSWPRIEE